MNSCWISAIKERDSIHPRPKLRRQLRQRRTPHSYGLTITKGLSVFKIGNGKMSISISDVGFFKFPDHVCTNLRQSARRSVLHASTSTGLCDVSICAQNVPWSGMVRTTRENQLENIIYQQKQLNSRRVLQFTD